MSTISSQDFQPCSISPSTPTTKFPTNDQSIKEYYPSGSLLSERFFIQNRPIAIRKYYESKPQNHQINFNIETLSKCDIIQNGQSHSNNLTMNSFFTNQPSFTNHPLRPTFTNNLYNPTNERVIFPPDDENARPHVLAENNFFVNNLNNGNGN